MHPPNTGFVGRETAETVLVAVGVVVIGFLMLLNRGREDFGLEVCTIPRGLGTAGAFARRVVAGIKQIEQYLKVIHISLGR